MTRLDISIAGAYLFFIVLLTQDTVAFMSISTGIDVPVSWFYAIKFLLLIVVAWLLAATKTLPRFGTTEALAVATGLVVTVLAVVKGGGAFYVADELRFYLVPTFLFLIGRTLAPLRSERQQAYFLMTVGILYVALGSVYELIGRGVLSDIGLKVMLAQKFGEVGRGNEFIDGYPINFWLFLRSGTVRFPRAFGALFDPLPTAFFGMPLCFYLWAAHRRRAIVGAGFMTIAVAAFICLTLTRAIILGIAAVFLAGRFFKKGIAAVPLWLVLALFVAAFVLVALNFSAILPFLDPSSLGHFEVYLHWDASTSLLGHRFIDDAPRGEESLYLTLLYECGIAGLVCYLTWFAHLYFRLRRGIGNPYVRAAFESLVVYLVASCTTEHWFASSSGSLFWFLLGNTLTVVNEERVRNDVEIGNGIAAARQGMTSEGLPA